MVKYKPAPLRPSAARGLSGGGLRKSGGRLGASALQEKVLVGTAAGTVVFAGLSTWVGINTGLNERGALSVAGWVVAAGSGLYAGFMIAQLIGAFAKGGSSVPATPFSR